MKNNLKKTIFIVCLILLLVGGYIIFNLLNKDEGLEYDEYLKNYEVNEYISTYVSDEDMAKIYLNDFVENMYFDTENSYYLLDSKYRKKKFGNIENYKNYVNTLNYSSYKLTKYYKKSKDGYIIFGVYDQNGNFFAFKTKGVMQYTVYLDDYTVEIW